MAGWRGFFNFAAFWNATQLERLTLALASTLTPSSTTLDRTNPPIQMEQTANDSDGAPPAATTCHPPVILAFGHHPICVTQYLSFPPTPASAITEASSSAAEPPYSSHSAAHTTPTTAAERAGENAAAAQPNTGITSSSRNATVAAAEAAGQTAAPASTANEPPSSRSVGTVAAGTASVEDLKNAAPAPPSSRGTTHADAGNAAEQERERAATAQPSSRSATHTAVKQERESAAVRSLATLPHIFASHGTAAYFSGHLHDAFGGHLHALHDPTTHARRLRCYALRTPDTKTPERTPLTQNYTPSEDNLISEDNTKRSFPSTAPSAAHHLPGDSSSAEESSITGSSAVASDLLGVHAALRAWLDQQLCFVSAYVDALLPAALLLTSPLRTSGACVRLFYTR